MTTYEVRIRGTINDAVEVEAATEDEAIENALSVWRFVEYEDLEVDSVKAQSDD